MVKHATRTMTFAEYARHQSVALQTIHNWYGKGWIKCVSRGKIDVDISDEMVASERGGLGPGDKRPGAAKPAEGPKDTSALYSATEAARVKENYVAMQKKLAFEQDAGALVNVDDAADVYAERLALMRTRMLDFPSKIAPRMVMLPDAIVAQDIAMQEVTSFLEEILTDAKSALDKITAASGAARVSHAG